MSRAVAVVWCVAAALLVGGCTSGANHFPYFYSPQPPDAPHTDPSQPPTPAEPHTDATRTLVASFEGQLPIGLLGVPLGTVVRVTGEAFDGSTLRTKTNDGKTFLRIATVNGKRLAEPVAFEFLRASEDVKKPKPGEKIDYYVHEYGEFDGVVTPPEELGINGLLLQHDGFHYRRRLTVHASNTVQK